MLERVATRDCEDVLLNRPLQFNLEEIFTVKAFTLFAIHFGRNPDIQHVEDFFRAERKRLLESFQTYWKEQGE